MSNVINLSRPRGVARTTGASQTETCVICGSDTGVPVGLRIDYRIVYVRGVGQTCPNGCRQSRNVGSARSMLRSVIKYMIDTHGMQTARDELFSAANDLMK